MASPDMPWREAIITVLKQAGGALRYTEIAEQIAKQNLRKKLGATPANTVAMTLSAAAKSGDSDNPFIKTERGRYMLREDLLSILRKDAPTTESRDVSDDEMVVAEDIPVVKTVGMYWNIDRIEWKTKPRLLGQQQQGSAQVDFGPQMGIYILYDRNRVIYVGRAIEQPLGQRLAQHLKDRLNGRWDRFSWFGLRGVSEDGSLGEPDFTANQNQLISLMEAILIEALEPPLNRKRGDDFSEREYLQVEDPILKSKTEKALLEKLLSRMN